MIYKVSVIVPIYGSEGLYTVTFNNKQELLPISVELPL